ncbi:MAG: phasin family protein [Gammaproteobacteria bacterium]|nr:phasin family protein [Gammaproteobacteria bacterium]
MNPFENTAKLGRDLFELNTDTVRRITELSTENFKKYVELNQEYAQKLPEIRDISTFVELQRDYGQNVWEGLQEDMKARGSIVREAVEQTGGLFRGVFNAEEADVDAEVAAADAEAA